MSFLSLAAFLVTFVVVTTVSVVLCGGGGGRKAGKAGKKGQANRKRATGGPTPSTGTPSKASTGEPDQAQVVDTTGQGGGGTPSVGASGGPSTGGSPSPPSGLDDGRPHSPKSDPRRFGQLDQQIAIMVDVADISRPKEEKKSWLEKLGWKGARKD